MTQIANTIKSLMMERNLSPGSLALKSGLSREGVYKILKGERHPSLQTIKKIADGLGVSIGTLTGEEPLTHLKPQTKRIPVIGTISCGEPILAEQQAEYYIEIPADLCPSGEIIALRMKGDSMEKARLCDGDLAFIRLQDTIEDGEIAAVCVGDSHDEATIKKVRFLDDYISLVPQTDNPEYRPMSYRPEQVRVVGKVLGVWWG